MNNNRKNFFSNYFEFINVFFASTDITITITNTIVQIPIEGTGIRTIVPITAEEGERSETDEANNKTTQDAEKFM